MVIDICIPTLNQREAAQNSFSSLKARQKNDNRYIIVDNGSTPPVREWLIGLSGDDIVIRNDENVGLPKALNQARVVSKADYIFNTHSDIYMFEQDWDEKVAQAIEEAGNVGVAGFFGAMGIGTSDIYHSPYLMQQMVRTNTISGNRCKLNPAIHGQMQFSQLWLQCAVLDGFSLICKKELKFWQDSVHHCYDNQIALESIDRGLKNICINLDVDHLGGKTDVGEDWASPFGKTKQQIHEESHLPFYEYWRPGKHNICLPYHI